MHLIYPEVISKFLMAFIIIYYDKRLSIVKFQKRAIEYSHIIDNEIVKIDD